MSRFAFVAVLLVGFCAGLCGVARGDDASVDEEVERWVTILREYRLPEPGPIDSRTARLQRQIMQAPLEELPPPIRTGFTLIQIRIHMRSGDWDGIVELSNRMLSGPSWTSSPLDVIPLKQIGEFYHSTVFPPPGGRAAGESQEVFSGIALGFWERNIKDSRKWDEMRLRIVDRSDPRFVETAAALYSLYNSFGRQNQVESILQLAEDYGIPSVEELYGLDHYDEWGRYISREAMLEQTRAPLERLERNAREWNEWAENGGVGPKPRPPHFVDASGANVYPIDPTLNMRANPFQEIEYTGPVPIATQTPIPREAIAHLLVGSPYEQPGDAEAAMRRRGELPVQRRGHSWLEGWRLGVVIAGVCSFLAVLVAAVVILRRVGAR